MKLKIPKKYKKINIEIEIGFVTFFIILKMYILIILLSIYILSTQGTTLGLTEERITSYSIVIMRILVIEMIAILWNPLIGIIHNVTVYGRKKWDKYKSSEKE